jgi:hypothetical protein
MPSCGNGCDAKCTDDGRYERANGVVYDQTRDIFWQEQTGPHVVFADAVSYCANLSLGGADRGWRLPSYEELANLLYKAGGLHAGSPGSCTPAIDQAAFPTTAIDYHWMVDGNTGPRPQAISFFDGREHTLFADTPAIVRCIHDPIRSQ